MSYAPVKRKRRVLENLREQIDKTDSELEKLRSLALELGASETNLHLSNVVKIIERAVKEKLEADEKAKEAGYKTTLIAIKALGQKNTFVNVPTELTISPSQWICPRSISEIRSGGKTLTRTNPAVSATQAQGKLKKLLPLIDELCSASTEQEIEELKDAFYTLSYESFSEELLGLVAEKRGRENPMDKTMDDGNGPVVSASHPSVGEHILNYQYLTERWLKDGTDFSRLVKEAMAPLPIAEVTRAAVKDQETDNNHAYVATLLINRAFFEVAEIDLALVTTYEQHEQGELKLPTTGKDFLHRLRKVGLGASIKNYRMAMLSRESLIGDEGAE